MYSHSHRRIAYLEIANPPHLGWNELENILENFFRPSNNFRMSSLISLLLVVSSDCLFAFEKMAFIYSRFHNNNNNNNNRER